MDANKTTLTKQVTEAASLWLAEKGFKPVETEVPVADHWIADIASATVPSPTEAVNLKLIRKRPPWTKTYHDDIAKWNEERADLPSIVTAVIEVKTSRSDFTRDDKFTRQSPAHLLYLAFPAGLIKPDEVPSHVGLISCTDGAARCVRPAQLQNISDKQAASVVYAVAVRRDHFTAFERYREMERQSRERSNERSNKAKTLSVVRAVCDVINGVRNVEDALRWYGVKIGKDRDSLSITREIEHCRQRELAID